MRLTLLYGSLFLVSGAFMLGITNVLVHTGNSFYFDGSRVNGVVSSGQKPSPAGPASATVRLGRGAGQPRGGQLLHHVIQTKTEILKEHNADVHKLLVESGITLAIMAMVSVALGWMVAGRVLRPLRTITAAARAISASNLAERLDLTGPDDEFKRLADTLDDLFGRLEAAFEAQRHFVANASHELRTPLALERALLQVALADPDAPAQALRVTCSEVLVAGEQQQRLIEALLTLATSERGLDHREPFDLAKLATEVLETPRPAIAELDLSVITEIRSAPASGDPSLVERLVANLVDNAVRYNLPGGRVEISTGAKRGCAVLSVTNTGAVIAPHDLDRLFQPFQRLEATRTSAEGHGLGLSIVRAIAAAHGAVVTAHALPLGGLEVGVSFPDPHTASAAPKPGSF